MSKRGQETTSSEGSPMAKPKPMVPVKAKPVNLVLRSPWSARENLPQNLGYPVNPGSVAEGQGDHTSTRRHVRTTQNPEAERSLVRRQESAQSSDSWKQYDQEEASTLPVQGDVYGQQLQEQSFKHEVPEPSVHDEDLPFSTKEVGNSSRLLNILNGSIKDKCVDKENGHIFVNESSHSSWTELFGEIGGPQEYVLRGTSELVHITEKLILEHSEEILNVNTIDSASPSWTRSVLSHDQVIQWKKPKVRVYSDSDLCLGKMNDSRDGASCQSCTCGCRRGQIKERKCLPALRASASLTTARLHLIAQMKRSDQLRHR